MTLYLKYRPQKIADLDLEEVRTSLEKMVKGGNIPHALLLRDQKERVKLLLQGLLPKC